MSENCNQNCSSCGEDCAERKEQKTDFSAKLNELSSVKKVIGVVSGKGGVGKSLVTSMIAVTMNRVGYHSAILDADVTGPSIPKAFGIKGKATGSEFGLFPAKSKTGIDIMSVNLLLENDTDPVVWRGPIIGNTVKQFWTDVIWSDVDFMFIDMPPGTGDVPLTVFQSIPVDGIIIVTSPQELVSMIVSKAVKMAEMMNIPIIGLVENMSYFKCQHSDLARELFHTDPSDKKAKTEHYRVIQDLAKQFEKENGSIICRELLGLSKKADNPVPEDRTDSYYRKRPCAELVEQAARILDEYILNKKMEEKK